MTIKIANAQAFWGDRTTAAEQIVRQVEDLDILTMDYLAEVSMSILAIQKEKNPSLGYAKDFLDVVHAMVSFWKAGRTFKLIANAGGLNPLGCAEACKKILEDAGCIGMKIGVVTGDDVLHELQTAKDNYNNFDTGQSLENVKDRLCSANVYLGSQSIIKALNSDADIIITGRVADPCLTAAPCMWKFKWSAQDYNQLASGIIAGHLIECGTQVTGGFSTNWLDLPDMASVGYPIVEIDSKGNIIVTKPENSGGAVTIETVKEQLLYEIGDPDNYICPDVIVSFLGLKVETMGENRIQVTGATGKPPPDKLKVSATYRDGYRVEGMITVFGKDCRAKALKCGEIVRERLRQQKLEPQKYHVECLGTGDVVPSMPKTQTMETVLRICAIDQSKEPLLQLAKEIAPLVTSGPQGVTGYTSGRPKVRPLFSFWPTLINRELVKEVVTILEVGK